MRFKKSLCKKVGYIYLLYSLATSFMVSKQFSRFRWDRLHPGIPRLLKTVLVLLLWKHLRWGSAGLLPR